MKDSDKMPFGKHKGKPLVEVPHLYWIYLYDLKKLNGELLRYAEENVPVLRFQLEKKQKDDKNES
jgi:uncharacterized protein (DUF3820 family)